MKVSDQSRAFQRSSATSQSPQEIDVVNRRANLACEVLQETQFFFGARCELRLQKENSSREFRAGRKREREHPVKRMNFGEALQNGRISVRCNCAVITERNGDKFLMAG